uniref:Uncharacterized protein n=1 Tax=Arundo donax TaxID=35708 RepID=A0A0A9CKB9_ARUDO
MAQGQLDRSSDVCLSKISNPGML